MYEIECQIFGTFLAFWIAEYIQFTKYPMSVLVLLFCTTVLIILLRVSLYSESQNNIARYLLSLLTLFLAFTIIPILNYIFPENSDQLVNLNLTHIFVLVGSLFFWMLIGEIRRKRIIENIELRTEFYEGV